MAVYMIKIERSNMSENGWKMFLFIVIFLWLVTISTIIYFVVSGTAPLIDRSIDLYYITLPILALALIYVSVSICIFGIYLVGYGKVKNKQLIAIQQRNTNKKYQYEISNNKKTLLYECRDAVAYLNGNGGIKYEISMGMKNKNCCTNAGMLLLI